MRAFQRETLSTLESGASALLVAPTGLGKTRAAVEPFARHLGGAAQPLLGTRLLYVLPLRALAAGVEQELQARLPAHIPIRQHRGDRPESYLYSEPATITTIDQYLAAFAGAPLSFATRHGHAVAGAVLASYSVFDEVHLLSPQKGLPLLLALLQQRQRWGLRSLVMTATLPRSVRSLLQEEAGLKEIAVDPQEVQEQRDNRRRVTLEVNPDPILTEHLLAQVAAAAREQPVILFANTVERALGYYAALQEHAMAHGFPVMLAHSRFTPTHRACLQQQVEARFGRGAGWGRGVLVSTQVAEAGLNISAPVVFTEAAPVDSIIQRAGRCARFVPEQGVVNGLLRVFVPTQSAAADGGGAGALQPAPAAPYDPILVQESLTALLKRSGHLLTWPLEQELVNEVLDAPYACYLRGERYDPKRPVDTSLRRVTTARALGLYEQAYRSRNPGALERELREALPVSVVIRPREQLVALEAGAEPPLAREVAEHLALPKTHRPQLEAVSVSLGALYLHLEPLRSAGGIYELRVEAAGAGGQPVVKLQPAGQVRPGRTYVVATEAAGYTATEGLTFQPREAGLSTGWSHPRPVGRPRGQSQPQDFFQHSRGVCNRVQYLGQLYRPFFRSWTRVFAHSESEQEKNWADETVNSLLDMLSVAALYHDIGKLSKEWQERVDGRPPRYIARTGDATKRPVPPHAGYAFPFIQRLLAPYSPDAPIDRYIALAAARHHGIGREGDTLRWQPATFGPDVLRVLAELPPSDLHSAALQPAEINLHLDEALLRQLSSGGQVTVDAPSPADDFYLLYCLANRLIKLADFEDAAGADIELQGLPRTQGGVPA